MYYSLTATFLLFYSNVSDLLYLFYFINFNIGFYSLFLFIVERFILFIERMLDFVSIFFYLITVNVKFSIYYKC